MANNDLVISIPLFIKKVMISKLVELNTIRKVVKYLRSMHPTGLTVKVG